MRAQPTDATLIVVSSGQFLSGVTLAPHQTLNVQAGGTIENIVAIGSPGAGIAGPIINLYGLAEGTTVADGGQLRVKDGGLAVNTILDAGGDLTDNGRANGTIIGSAAYLDDYHYASATQVLNGGQLDVGGTAIDATVFSGGLVELTGLLENSTIQAGGQIEDFAGGLNFSGDVISAGGLLVVLPPFITTPSSATQTEIKSGGTLITTPGGSISGLTIDQGATLLSATDLVFTAANGPLVTAGNNLSGTVLGFGQYETVFAGGVTYATVLTPDTNDTILPTEQVVASGGRTQGTSIGARGDQYVYGQTDATTILSGGEEDLYMGSALATIIESGGLLEDQYGMTAGTIVYAGGLLELQDTGATAENTLISGGSMTVSGSEQATNTIIRGGQQTLSNGHATSTVISAGGTQTLAKSAVASATLIYAGGEQVLTGYGAQASLTTIAKSGVQRVSAGTAVNTLIQAGGQQVVTSDGTATTTTIDSGGRLVDTLGNALVSNVTIQLGGTLDFPTLAFVAGATATVNATDLLTIHDGGQTVTLQLAGTYTADHFAVTADPSGGTYVTLSAAHAIGIPPEALPPQSQPDITNPTPPAPAAALHPITQQTPAEPLFLSHPS
jgi:autotransporter passenger strand-loop-strand repeat protein